MQIALISDIHANLPALESVLSAISKINPDLILSLGDQVNLGPSSPEVLSLLREYNVDCLHGNHERYILSVLNGDSGYSGANFRSLHFNAQHINKEEISFPMFREIEGIIFTHALPDDDRYPVYDTSKAPSYLSERFCEGHTHLICGHGHNPTHYALPHLRLDSIGSAGCMDDGTPGAAPWTLLTIRKDVTILQPYYAPYDVNRLPSLFIRSGMVDYCPIMAHIACLQPMHAREYLVPFVTLARNIQHERGESEISMETWQETDHLFPWPDGLDTVSFWRRFHQ